MTEFLVLEFKFTIGFAQKTEALQHFQSLLIYFPRTVVRLRGNDGKEKLVIPA